MDYIAILQRAFRITLTYRVLWIFGFFLALCSASGNIMNNGGSSSGSNQNGNGFDQGNFNFPFESIPLPADNIWMIVAGMVAVVICLIVLASVVGVIVRAVTRTALIGMVDQIEETETATLRDGWRFGWSKQAWTVFLVNLITIGPLVVIFGALLVLALAPFLLLWLDNSALRVVGIVAGSGLSLLWLLAVISATIVVSPFLELGWRYVVLRQLGAVDSLKTAYALIRHKLKDVAITVVLLAGIFILWSLVSFILFIIVMLLGLLVGVILGLMAFLMTQTWWIALLVGLPTFIALMIGPLVFANGLYLTFRSAVWTLAFRELTLTGASNVSIPTP